jgi:hypothetical protein
MNKIEQKILELNDPEESYFYCLANDSCNLKAHEKIIIESKDPEECYFFAKDIYGANKQLLSEIVLASGNLHLIKLFYNNINFDKSRYEKLMLFI